MGSFLSYPISILDWANQPRKKPAYPTGGEMASVATIFGLKLVKAYIKHEFTQSYSS